MAEYCRQPAGPHYGYYQPPSPPPPSGGQPPQPYIPQPPAFASYTGPFAAYGSYDEVRTLFVAGLPEDVKPREIYNLFREFPGYESSHLRSSTQNSQPFAFAVFTDQYSAIAALYALNGMVFDLEKGSTLYIDLAKSNSRSKRSRAGLLPIMNGLVQIRKPEDPHLFFGLLMTLDSLMEAHIAHVLHACTLAGFGNVHMPGMGNSAQNMIGHPRTQSHGNFESRTANEITTAKLNNSPAHVSKSAYPCATLFVANLGPTCTEQELIQVFTRCPGFLKLKMQSRYGPPVAFIDFKDTASSTAVLNNLQGRILYSSPASDGMQLEYAKSRMGMLGNRSNCRIC